MRYEICFHPSWWYKNGGIRFGKEFWDDPEFRMKEDCKMRRILYDKFGEYGIGDENPTYRPLIGSDLTACGYLFSEMLGCKVLYADDNSPQVLCAELDDEACYALQVPDFDTDPVWQRVEKQLQYLYENYGYVESHINLQGVQNLAMDLRGQNLFIDYFENEDLARHVLNVCCETMREAGKRLMKYTPALSAGVTNIVKHVCPNCYVTSNCTVEMISQAMYEEFLLEYDNRLATEFPDFGIHHCGKTMEHVVKGYAKVNNLKFVEVGAFSNLEAVADALSGDVLINARYSPVQLMSTTEEQLRKDLKTMTEIVPGDRLSISCVGIDASCSDDRIKLFLAACKEVLEENDILV